jgi:hypothetical protein
MAGSYLWRDDQNRGMQRDMSPQLLFASQDRSLDAIEEASPKPNQISACLAYSEPQNSVGIDLQRRRLNEFAWLLCGDLADWQVSSVGVSHPKSQRPDLHLLRWSTLHAQHQDGRAPC